jgi:hypothetical protein
MSRRFSLVNQNFLVSLASSCVGSVSVPPSYEVVGAYCVPSEAADIGATRKALSADCGARPSAELSPARVPPPPDCRG